MTMFVLRVVDCHGRHSKQLWPRVLPALEVAPEDIRQLCLNAHAEALTLSKHQRLASRHVADATAKNLASIITLRRHAWLQSANIMDDIKTRIENLPFDASGLFNKKTDDILENLHKSKKTAKSYSIQQQPKYGKFQWRSKYPQQTFQQSTSQAYHSFKPSSQPRSTQPSASASGFRSQSTHRRQAYKSTGTKSKQYL